MIVDMVIPVLNEARNLGPLLDAVAHELAGEPHTICLVDDGSDDGSPNEIKQLMETGKYPSLRLICHETRCGQSVSESPGSVVRTPW